MSHGTAAGGGTVSPWAGASTQSSAELLSTPEFPSQVGADALSSASNGVGVDRALSPVPSKNQGPTAKASGRSKDQPSVVLSFDGINHFEQRWIASGGNQFSLEPPDQALCAGNGFVVEATNDTIQVFSTSGSALTTPLGLNAFYGYAYAIDRTIDPATGKPRNIRGPFVTDPGCYYDIDTQRWLVDVLTLEQYPSGGFKGGNHLDIAVSAGADPRGSWSIYHIDTTDDGQNGTPNHHCPGDNMGEDRPNACLGDFPHLGVDANGVYLTTNEYGLFSLTNVFNGAQLYALSKAALVSGAASVPFLHYENLTDANGQPGFTVWPATSPGGQYATAAGGTEYFMSSNAAAEANGSGTSSQIAIWALMNTSSLGSGGTPALATTFLASNSYTIPAHSNQRSGSTPLADCLNSPTCATNAFGKPDPTPESEGSLDSSDSRILGVTYLQGRLLGVLDTALNVQNVDPLGVVQTVGQAGIAYFEVQPSASGSAVAGQMAFQGYIAAPGANNVIYPAVGIAANGRGLIGFTLVGADYFPSAGYVPMDIKAGPTTSISVPGAGQGPQDGFSEYNYFASVPVVTTRPRWGDYGAAAVDGNNIWWANEYIAQTCTLAQYNATDAAGRYGTCGGTRSALANWGTRITEATP